MKKKNVILVLVVGLAFISSLVVARTVEECVTALKLTPEQKEKMQKMCLDFQKEMLPLQTDLKAKSLDMKALLNEKADVSKLNALIDEMTKIRAEMMKKTLAHHNQTRGLLTEEQKALLGKSGCGMVGRGMHGGMYCGMMGSGMHGGMSCSMGCGMKGTGMHQSPDKNPGHGKAMSHACKK